MIQICFPVFLWHFSETCGYGIVNKSISLYSVRAITEKSVLVFIPVSNEPSGCLQTFGDCREGQIPRCSAALQV